MGHIYQKRTYIIQIILALFALTADEHGKTLNYITKRKLMRTHNYQLNIFDKFISYFLCTY